MSQNNPRLLEGEETLVTIEFQPSAMGYSHTPAQQCVQCILLLLQKDQAVILQDNILYSFQNRQINLLGVQVLLQCYDIYMDFIAK